MRETAGCCKLIREDTGYFSLTDHIKNRTKIQKNLDFAAVPAHDDKCNRTKADEGGITHRCILLHLSPRSLSP